MSFKCLFLERPVLTYDFRLPPGPRTVEYVLLAEDLGFRAVWCPEVPAFGHDIWVTLARITEKTKRIKFGPSRADPELSPSDGAGLGHRDAGAVSTGTPDGRLRHRLHRPCGDGQETPDIGQHAHAYRTGQGIIVRRRCRHRRRSPQDPSHPTAGCPTVQSTCQSTWQPKAPRPARSPKRLPDGLISLGGPAEGFETCLVSTSGTVLDDGEDVTSPRVSTAVKPLVALAYHSRYTAEPESVKALLNGEAWLASVERVGEKIRHLSIHRGHNLDISNGHDALVDVSAAKQMTFTGTREELRERLVQIEARGATGIIFGTSGYDVERELRAYAEVAGLR